MIIVNLKFFQQLKRSKIRAENVF